MKCLIPIAPLSSLPVNLEIHLRQYSLVSISRICWNRQISYQGINAMSPLQKRIKREQDLYKKEKALYSGKLETRMKKIRKLQDADRRNRKKLQDRCDRILGSIIRKNADALLQRDMHGILDEFVTRKHERPLFGLPPLQPETGAAGPDPEKEDEDRPERMEGTVIIRRGKDEVLVETPGLFDDFRNGIRALGGDWSRAGKHWHAPAAVAGEVEALARRCYEKVEIRDGK